MIVTLLPAAGASRRMGGRDKLLERAGDEALLRRSAKTALAAGLGPVVVTLRPGDGARRATLEDLALGIVEVPDADTGMAASLRAGAARALAEIRAAAPTGGDRRYSGMLVFPPDMPDIETSDLARFAEAFEATGGAILRAVTQDGTPGHPVLFPDFVLGDFESLAGDRGAAKLLDAHRLATVALPGRRALTDLDTPEDWARWRAAHPPSSA